MPAEQFSAEEQVIFGESQDRTPDLRLLHYNDVYHVDASSAEPVGGIARFMTLIKEYREDGKFQGQPELISLFSGDAWNPSLESSVTKGRLPPASWRFLVMVMLIVALQEVIWCRS